MHHDLSEFAKVMGPFFAIVILLFLIYAKFIADEPVDFIARDREREDWDREQEKQLNEYLDAAAEDEELNFRKWEKEMDEYLEWEESTKIETDRRREREMNDEFFDNH